MTQAQLNTSVLLSGCQHVADLDRQADFDRRLAAEMAVKLEKHGATAAPIMDAAHTAARAAFAKGRSPVWIVVDAANAARQAAGEQPMELSHQGQLADFLDTAGSAAGRDEDVMALLIMCPEAAEWAAAPKEQPLPEALAEESITDARLAIVLARIQRMK